MAGGYLKKDYFFKNKRHLGRGIGVKRDKFSVNKISVYN